MNSAVKATRPCPNRCGTPLPAGTYACRACWRILPRNLRTAITTTWTSSRFREHEAAKAAAQTWYDARADQHLTDPALDEQKGCR